MIEGRTIEVVCSKKVNWLLDGNPNEGTNTL